MDDVLLETGPMTEQQARPVLQRLYKLLSRCHSGLLKLPDDRGYVLIVHRDLKGANLLFDKHRISKVGDWGSAKMVVISAEDAAFLQAAELGGSVPALAPYVQMRTNAGTPMWTPGDVVSASTAATDGYHPTVDCYAGGIVGVEMLLGGWQQVWRMLAAAAFAAPGGFDANHTLYEQQLRELAAGRVMFPKEQRVETGLASFMDFLRRACGLGCPRTTANLLPHHPWLQLK